MSDPHAGPISVERMAQNFISSEPAVVAGSGIVERLTALLAKARADAAAEMREKCADAGAQDAQVIVTSLGNMQDGDATGEELDRAMKAALRIVKHIRALPIDAQDDAWLRVHDQKIAGIVLRESAKAIRAVFSICGRSEDWESGSLDGRAKCAALLETLVDVDWSSILTEAAKERT
jgi:hypothetical protein